MADSKRFTIKPVRTPSNLQETISLFTAYTKWLNIDLTFQDYTSEMVSLPGKYAPPRGEILLAFNAENEAIGCVALRPLDYPACCELKRLYVSPKGRGLGIGKALVKEILDVAAGIGYSEVRLDTLNHMEQAIGLYKHFGFVETEKYYETPLINTVFLSKKLS